MAKKLRVGGWSPEPAPTPEAPQKVSPAAQSSSLAYKNLAAAVASQTPPTAKSAADHTNEQTPRTGRAAHDDSLVIAELGHDAGQPGVIVQCLRLRLRLRLQLWLRLRLAWRTVEDEAARPQHKRQ